MATYTKDQITKYLQHIGLEYPPQDDLTNKLTTDPLGLLRELQIHHMARVPFESLTLHYSKHRHISLETQDLFHKIVDNNRGGYCMEVNTLFGCVLRSLGYTLIGVGGRVKSPVLGYKGWDHMVNLVTINNQPYLVDVGFGADCPTHPIPLQHNHTFPIIHPGPSGTQGRLQYKTLEEHTDPNQRVWVYSTRENTETEWKDRYSFVEVEFFPSDFEVINLRMSTTPESFFVQAVMCVSLVLGAREDEGTGKKGVRSVLILFKDTVKRKFVGGIIGDHGNMNEREEVLEELKTEGDRVASLEKYFGIVLDQGEQRAIRGLASELRV